MLRFFFAFLMRPCLKSGRFRTFKIIHVEIAQTIAKKEDSPEIVLFLAADCLDDFFLGIV